MYEKRYESCQKKLDKLTLVSDRVSLLRGIAFVIATLLKIEAGAEKSNGTVVLRYVTMMCMLDIKLDAIDELAK